MKKDYEIALSYAHKDKEIADLIGRELENIFADGFFMDGLRPEELANADPFREKLKNIFQRSTYAVILYSKNYSKGDFTNIEMKKILEKEKLEKESQTFIININDCREIDEQMYDCTYVILTTNDSNEQEVDWEKVEEQVHDIIHKIIKKHIIMQTIEKKKRQKSKGIYSLRIQTLFADGNLFQWDKKYDWNILGKNFIDQGGRSIKWNTSWQKLWQHINTEFQIIKAGLNDSPEVKRRIHFNCHLSIAYKLGQVYGDLGQASGNRNLVLTSSNKTQNVEFVLNNTVHYKQIDDFCREYDGNNGKSADIVCIISIKSREQGNILETVKQYLEQQRMKYYKICLFQEEMNIDDADTLESVATYLRARMIQCRTGSDCKIHLFPDTTAPLMFALGARSIFPGTVQLYEYIPKEDTYEKALTN